MNFSAIIVRCSSNIDKHVQVLSVGPVIGDYWPYQQAAQSCHLNREPERLIE